MEWHDATIVFVDDVRNKGAGIEAGRVYKGIDGCTREAYSAVVGVEGWEGPIMIDHTLRPLRMSYPRTTPGRTRIDSHLREEKVPSVITSHEKRFRDRVTMLSIGEMTSTFFPPVPVTSFLVPFFPLFFPLLSRLGVGTMFTSWLEELFCRRSSDDWHDLEKYQYNWT